MPDATDSPVGEFPQIFRPRPKRLKGVPPEVRVWQEGPPPLALKRPQRRVLRRILTRALEDDGLQGGERRIASTILDMLGTPRRDVILPCWRLGEGSDAPATDFTWPEAEPAPRQPDEASSSSQAARLGGDAG